jgi:hypothetical protein
MRGADPCEPTLSSSFLCLRCPVVIVPFRSHEWDRLVSGVGFSHNPDIGPVLVKGIGMGDGRSLGPKRESR